MTSTRRTFLKNSATFAAATAAAGIAPKPLVAQFGFTPEPIPPIEDPRIKQLAQAALDSARASGANYADIRLTHQKSRAFVENVADTRWISRDTESMTVGVRTLVDGYWGFVSGPVWSVDEMARLGRSATHLARTNSLGKARRVDMAPVPVIADGHWMTPVKVNPFDVPRGEILDYFLALGKVGKRFHKFGSTGYNGHEFILTGKAFASSEGSYATQRLFQSGMYGRGWKFEPKGMPYIGALYEYISPSAKGWEMYRDQPLQEYLIALYEELKEDASLPVKPIDVGRYDVVFDARIVGGLVASSIGAATQLDRVLGYEANAGGTSYITDPQAMLGSLKIGSPLLTISGDRSTPGGAATVKWDDEGVEPDAVTLVQNGVLSDFITTRESAGWVNEWGLRSQMPFRSHGCAAAPEGVGAPLAHTPNLQMIPASDTADLSSLVASLEKGLLIKRGEISMDFQQLNGYGGGYTFEVKNGKRIAFCLGAGVLLRTPEFWKSIQAIGGKSSVKRYAILSYKGEPSQSVYHSVDAVPVRAKDMTIIDKLRKA